MHPDRQIGTSSGFQDVQWYSKALQKRMAFLLHLPTEYQEQARLRYPVLYLLHGAGHDRLSVLREVRPQQHLAALGESMLVIPDGEQGWWLDSPRVGRSCYSQYLLELVALVDERYRTLPDRSARGICGFSMGGFGAMLAASQHATVFGSASSLLGPLDIAELFPRHYRLRLLLGSDLATWQIYNPTYLAPSLAHAALKFSTAEAAFDRSQNVTFAAALRSLGLPFDYQVDPGSHDTAFVREHIGAHFDFHWDRFSKAIRAE